MRELSNDGNSNNKIDKIKVTDILLKVLSALVVPILLWAAGVNTEIALLKKEVVRLEQQAKGFKGKEEKLIEKLSKQAQDLALLTQKIGQIKEDSDELRRKLGK